MNSDNSSIGVLSPIRPGKHFIFHSRKGSGAHFLPFCRAGSVDMAAQFGNVLKYTAERAEKGGVEAPRSITLSTPIRRRLEALLIFLRRDYHHKKIKKKFIVSLRLRGVLRSNGVQAQKTKITKLQCMVWGGFRLFSLGDVSKIQ